ncbi:MAG: D-aminoacyl-tRNA deacylase [Pseudomonadota bacterium]|nr:D-aminoacyl-tRNA deacylase [Pseudomonadota bacterium]
MRALIQRVSKASVSIDGNLISEIKYGLLIFICAMADDVELDAEKMASKISKIRIFNDKDGKMNKSLIDIGGEALIVSQFTLAADTSRGNRPGFSTAAAPEAGKKLYKHFIGEFKNLGITTKEGQFGGDMKVSILNDGPITVWIDNRDSQR